MRDWRHSSRDFRQPPLLIFETELLYSQLSQLAFMSRFACKYRARDYKAGYRAVVAHYDQALDAQLAVFTADASIQPLAGAEEN